MTKPKVAITYFQVCENFACLLDGDTNSRYDSVDAKLETVQVRALAHMRWSR